jgi:hypothetical protein
LHVSFRDRIEIDGRHDDRDRSLRLDRRFQRKFDSQDENYIRLRGTFCTAPPAQEQRRADAADGLTSQLLFQ